MGMNKELDKVMTDLDNLACTAAFMSKALHDLDCDAVSHAEQRGAALVMDDFERRVRHAMERLNPYVYGADAIPDRPATAEARTAPPDLTEPAPRPGKRRRAA